MWPFRQKKRRPQTYVARQEAANTDQISDDILPILMSSILGSSHDSSSGPSCDSGSSSYDSSSSSSDGGGSCDSGGDGS